MPEVECVASEPVKGGRQRSERSKAAIEAQVLKKACPDYNAYWVKVDVLGEQGWMEAWLRVEIVGKLPIKSGPCRVDLSLPAKNLDGTPSRAVWLTDLHLDGERVRRLREVLVETPPEIKRG